MGIFTRETKLYVRIKGVDGRWTKSATGLDDTPEGRVKAAKQLADLERQVAAKIAEAGGVFVMTVNRYADGWLARRKTGSVGDDRTRLRLHALPHIGHLPIAEVTELHMRDLVMALRNDSALAPRTIRDVSGLLHTMFKSAKIEGVIQKNPVEYERGVLPKPVDKDPTWRHEAIYTRAEIESLISDGRLRVERRVLYALKSLAALRHEEAASLTWSQYDTVTVPLGAINLGKTKSGVPRRIPVHPTLAKVLAAWKLSGWEALYGRQPKADDFIVPTRNLTARGSQEAQKQLVADLGLLGLRQRAGASTVRKQNRRGHDMRRTFITLARADGAVKDILRWATHGPTAKDMMDVYSSFDWPTLCAEVVKLKIELVEGKLLAMPIAANGGGSGPPGWEPPILVPIMSRSERVRANASKTTQLRDEKTDPRAILTSPNEHAVTLAVSPSVSYPQLGVVPLQSSVAERQDLGTRLSQPIESGKQLAGVETAGGLSQSAGDPIAAELEAARAEWDGDRRVLRRRLLALITTLDD